MKKSTLRQQAEEKMGKQKSAEIPTTGADAQALRLVHELRVHQIELEMQNEELMQARAEAEGAYRQYTDLYDFAPVGYFTLARDGSISKVNLAGATLLGLRRVDLLKRRLGTFTSDESRAAFNVFFDKLLTGEGKKNCELMFEKKEDAPLWAWLEATCFEGGQECRVAMIDISERKRAEMELIQSEAKFRSTFDQSPVGSVIVGLDKHFIRCNSAFCNFLGYPESELIGKTISDITHPEDLEIGMKELKQMVEGKIESYTKQKRYLRKDGSIVWGEISIRLVRDAKNEPLYFLPIIKNITERKRAEELIHQYASDLEQRVEERTTELVRASRVKDEFLANMSHELRTPLSGILGGAELLLEGVYKPLNEKQRKTVKIIHASGKYLLELINDILDLARIESGKFEIHPEVVDAREICQSSLDVVTQLADKKSIVIEYAPSPNAVTIFVDPKRLKQILINLLNNAVKFTPAKGTVKLEVEADVKTSLMRFSITDTGIGIRSEDLQKIFDPFVQVDSSSSRQYEGSGLWGWLWLKLVDLHSGKLEVQSEIDKGSCFSFTLPWGQGSK